MRSLGLRPSGTWVVVASLSTAGCAGDTPEPRARASSSGNDAANVLAYASDSSAGEQNVPATYPSAPADRNAGWAVPEPVKPDTRAAERAAGSVPQNDAGLSLTQRAYASLTRGDVAQVSELIGELDRAGSEQPSDGHTVFYAGAFRLWKLSEGMTSLWDFLTILDLMEGTLTSLERAHALHPTDFRVTSFFALWQTLYGGMVGDDAMLERGLTTHQLGISQFPSYGHFMRGLATSNLPVDHPDFHRAIEDMLAFTQACNIPVDDAGTFHYPSAGDPSPHRGVCMNEGIVPHVFEGAFLSFGDTALKAGWDAERARAVYRSAQTAPTYAAWPFARALEERIEQAEQRAELYRNGDPFDDPSLWIWSGSLCTGCHLSERAQNP